MTRNFVLQIEEKMSNLTNVHKAPWHQQNRSITSAKLSEAVAKNTPDGSGLKVEVK